MAQQDGDAMEAFYNLLLDFEHKAINYLLLGNGAGFAGSLAVLKDYSASPYLQGVGMLVRLFGAGLVAGTLCYALIPYVASEILKMIHAIAGKPSMSRLRVYATIQSLLMLASGGFLVASVIMIMVRVGAF